MAKQRNIFLVILILIPAAIHFFLLNKFVVNFPSWGDDIIYLDSSDEDNDDLKRLDMGLTFGGGVEINAIMLGISYDLGLANISSYQQDGATSKNKVLKFSVGYRF